MSSSLTADSLAQLFVAARTYNDFRADPIGDGTLLALYDLLKWGPTAANGCPARFIFVKSKAAKEKLKPALSLGNESKTMAAPVTVIVGRDLAFYEKLPVLFPHTDARSWFEGNDAAIAETSLRDSSLQGAYLILAARSLGLDCGPMGGFDKARVDAEFFAGTSIKSVFLINLGHGDASKLYPRNQRLPFNEACQII